MKTTKSYFNFLSRNPFLDGFLHLLFPSSCIICRSELLQTEKHCCSVCSSELAFTHYELAKEPTELDQLFWGRVPVFSTYSLLYYAKNNNSKPLLHNLKYKNRPDIGVFYGKMIGEKIKLNRALSSVDVLIPVPLHRKKKYIRGYNQSEKLASGVCSVWDKPLRSDIISRGKHTQSQTRLGRFKRWDNVEDLFFVKETICNYKHVALIDDVITTGSTLESIMHSIRKISPEIKISVISLAVAK